MSDPNPRDPLPDEKLIRRLLDNVISPDEFSELQSRLESDETFRLRYVQLVDLEAGLYEECSLPRQENATVSARRPSTGTWKRVAALLIAAAAIVLLLVVFEWPQGAPEGEPRLAEEDEPATSEEPVTVPPAFEFRPAKIEDTPPAAVLTQISRDGSVGFPVGHRFRPGTLVLRHGRVQLDFLSGARVAVVGPAELQIISKDAATLVSGQATARVPRSARGFVLNTPEAAVVDLGTEFGVQVGEDGAAQVDVLQGEVEVSLLGDDGNTLISHRFDESVSVHIDQAGINPNQDGIPIDYPRIPALFTSPLPAGDEYRDAVMQSEPLIYWRFEQQQDGTVANETGDRWDARINRDADDPDCLRIADGHLVMRRSAQPRWVAPDDPLPGLNDGEFTIEMWIRPEQLTHMTCLSVVPAGDPGVIHLNVIEIAAARTNLIHEPGSVRFLHRYPPAKGPPDEINLFTKATCTPGQWQHVVAVKGDGVLELYSDGRLARQILLDLSNEPADYDLYLGQLRKSRTLRQFVGAIDEFALYDRALSPEEIEQHYRIIPREDVSKPGFQHR